MTASSSLSTSPLRISLSSRPTSITALAAEIVVDGKVVANPNTNWKQVNAKLADLDIQAFIPGEKHGTREVFEEKLLSLAARPPARSKPWKRPASTRRKPKASCKAVRKDGKAVDIDGDYSETLARIDADKKAVGVFGLVLLRKQRRQAEGRDRRRRAAVVETVAKGEYPVSRPLFFYVKKAHLESVPGLKEYVEFFTADT